MSKKYYSIIGGGLAGLTVAKALYSHGLTNFKIFDIKTPKEIAKIRLKGLHYLHDNPMEMSLPKDKLTNYIKSDVQSMKAISKLYLKKTGLSAWEQESSIDHFKKVVEFYDIRSYKEQLIENFGDKYITIKTPIGIEDLYKIDEHSIWTFYTIDISKILSADFKSVAIFGKEALPPERLYAQCKSDHWVIYNTSEMESWYRASFIFGSAWLESTDPLFGVYIGRKIITFPIASVLKTLSLPHTLFVGRYATWNRKVLIHNIYNSVSEVIENGHLKNDAH